jgi:hypothetical protein
MSTQERTSITLPTEDNKTIHLRATTQAEVRQKQLYAALSIKPDPICKCKTITDNKNSVVPLRKNINFNLLKISVIVSLSDEDGLISSACC